ncbi:MAG: MaoC family dehydratase [SAR202 cluster bacterium]|nr:MaoC family dehydratase [SAR202 cluster bacterium]
MVAPPTMCNIFIRGLNRPDVKLQGARQRMHGGQTVESVAPICAGDRLSAVSRLKDVYTKTGRTGTMAFIVWETEFSNQQGARVAFGRESFMARLQDAAPG